MYRTSDQFRVGVFVSQAGVVGLGPLCTVCGEWDGQWIVTWLFSVLRFCGYVVLVLGPQRSPPYIPYSPIVSHIGPCWVELKCFIAGMWVKTVNRTICVQRKQKYLEIKELEICYRA